MKGHVFIANNLGRKIAAEQGIFGVFAEDREKSLWKKTRADILADLNCLRLGDRVFFYDIDDTAFWGIYEVASYSFLDESDIGFTMPAPYRFRLHPLMPLAMPMSENNLFSRGDAAQNFRSIFYKKVLGRGKACTHLFPEETAALTEALMKQNDRIPEASPRHLDSLKKDAQFRLQMIKPEFNADNRTVSLEKELEWWLTCHLDENMECRKFLGDLNDIEMFANYVPITISGGNIDLVVYHQREVDGRPVRYKISIIELKKDRATPDALRELENYVKWFVRNIVGVENEDIIQPILIASGFQNEVLEKCQHWNLSARKPMLIEYAVTSVKDLKFCRIGL